MDHLPLVSIIIPCFNNAETIAETIKTAQNQIYPEIEIIVVDDGSNDESTTIIKQIKDPRIRLISLPVNGGVAHARNIAIENSRGDWIQFLDADDSIRPGKLKRQVADCNGADIVISDCEDIFSDGRRVKQKNTVKNINRDGPISANEFFYRNPFRIHAPIVRRRCIEQAGGFDPSFFHEDWEFWIRVALLSPVLKYISGVECAYHRVEGSKSFDRIHNLERQIDCLELVRKKAYAQNEKYQKHIDSALSNIKFRLTVRLYRNNEPERAKKYFRLIKDKISLLEYFDIWLARSPGLRRFQGSLPGPRKIRRLCQDFFSAK